MKTIRNFLMALLMSISYQIIAQETEDKNPETTKESKESLAKTLNSIDWMDFKDELAPEYDLNATDFFKDCYPDFKDKLKRVPKLQVTGNEDIDWEHLFDKYLDLEEHIAKGGFEDISVKNSNFLPTLIREHVLNYLSRNLPVEEFLDEVRGTGTLSKRDSSQLRYLHEIREKVTSDVVISRETTFEDCKLVENIQMSLWKYSAQKGTAYFRIWHYIKLEDCKCNENKGSMELKEGIIRLDATIEGKFANRSFLDMRFEQPGKPKVIFLDVDCCPEKEVGMNEDPIPDGHDANTENCCFDVPASDSIGFFPAMSFGDNFNSSSFGIGAEYLHNFGTSFGNNQWFAGAQLQYLTQSLGDGELDQNFYAGAVIIENRTPLIPCLQWIQRISAQFGQGTVDAFGNKEDFSQFTIGLHTGFNVDLSSQVAIGADLAILTLGSTTLEPDGGPEIKEDIGDLSIGASQIRLGVRIKL